MHLLSDPGGHTENPSALRQVARRRGWDVVEVYSDAGIFGAKGRSSRI
jgi:hypothetical protein